MFSTASSPDNSSQTSNWSHLHSIIFISTAILIMDLLATCLSSTRKTLTSLSILSSFARYLRKTTFCPARQRGNFLGPLVGPLSPRIHTTSSPCTTTNLTTQLTSHIHALATTYSRSTYLGRSSFETPSTPTLWGRSRQLSSTQYLGLVCKLEPISGSVTLRLHPGDIESVLTTGWGKRSSDRISKWEGGVVVVHAPRSVDELAVLTALIQAAVSWVCKGEVEEGEDMNEDSGALRPLWLLPEIAL